MTVPARFNGPPHSANGGYAAGRLVHYIRATTEVEVTLVTPPPLDVRLAVSTTASGIELHDGEALVAQARLAATQGEPPAFVPIATARAAGARYLGLQSHPFPTCFVCGPDRDDGMALKPGPVGEGTVAAVWTPDASLVDGAGALGTEFGWAALDCPAGWSTDLAGRPVVLGRMTARIIAMPSVGDSCVVVGQLRALKGRKAFTASALYNADAGLLGYAEAVWLTLQGESRSTIQGPEGLSSGRR